MYQNGKSLRVAQRSEKLFCRQALQVAQLLIYLNEKSLRVAQRSEKLDTQTSPKSRPCYSN
jgi:hypothetical protein